MAPSAVDVGQKDVDHLPLKLNNKVNGASHIEDVQMAARDQTDYVLKAYRCFIADLCQQYNMGHPG